MSFRLEITALRDGARALRSLLERLEGRIEELEGLAAFEVVSESPARPAGAYQTSNPSTPCRAPGAPAGRSAASGSGSPSAGEFADGAARAPYFRVSGSDRTGRRAFLGWTAGRQPYRRFRS